MHELLHLWGCSREISAKWENIGRIALTLGRSPRRLGEMGESSRFGRVESALNDPRGCKSQCSTAIFQMTWTLWGGSRRWLGREAKSRYGRQDRAGQGKVSRISSPASQVRVPFLQFAMIPVLSASHMDQNSQATSWLPISAEPLNLPSCRLGCTAPHQSISHATSPFLVNVAQTAWRWKFLSSFPL